MVLYQQFVEQNKDGHISTVCGKSKEFPNLWKPELGCLKDYKLDVKFKDYTEPRLIRPRTEILQVSSSSITNISTPHTEECHVELG